MAELFTGEWCQFCPNSSEKLSNLSTRYGDDEFLFLEYHYSDRLSIPETEERITYYNVTEFPTVFLNGEVKVVGELDAATDMYERFFLTLSGEAETASFSNTRTVRQPDQIEIQITFHSLDARNSPSLYLRCVLFEDKQPKYPRTIRAVQNKPILIVEPNGYLNESFIFPLDPNWDHERLGIVFFLQEDQMHKIISSASFKMINIRNYMMFD